MCYIFSLNELSQSQAQTEFVMWCDPDSTLPHRSVPAVAPWTRQSSPACAGLQSGYSERCFPVKAALRVSWQAASVAARCLVTPQCRFNRL